ncbi:MAG: glycosyltransferase [Lachnospiraceae bacterium]
MVLSVCIITKNEEKNMAACLKSLSGYGFEIVVVDTGSTDHTVQIAAQYTDKLYEFPWQDDFAAAKNFALSKASNEYVMVMDSDEFLEQISSEKLQELYHKIETKSKEVGRIQRRNIYPQHSQSAENSEWINRIFSKEKFHYQGRIHEQVEAKNKEAYPTYTTPVVILHTGYDLTEEERKKKTQRNIKLLMMELQKLEEDNDTTQNELTLQTAYILYQLGKSYFMAKEYSTACNYFSQALSYDLNPKLEYVIEMVETYGYALLNSNRAQEALLFEHIYEEFKNSADFQFLMGLIYMNNQRFDEAVEEFKKAVLHRECRCVGVNSYVAWYNIGVIYECLGRIQEANTYYYKCGTYEPAQKRLMAQEDMHNDKDNSND